MLQAVRRALLSHGVAPGDAMVVACSHGPDSLALADAVLALRRPMRLGEVTIVYVHHGLRPEADEEAGRVEAFARSRVASFVLDRVTVDRRRRRGPEEAARAARYAALERTADQVGARFVLLGHTASDQAETVVGRLLRGAGPVGLAGIPPRRGRFLRPLLGLSRAEIEAYLRGRELVPSIDASNLDHGFQRNRLRHEVMPVLLRESPEAERALARAASALREVAEALDWAAGRALAELGPPPVSAVAVAALPSGLAKRVLQRLAEGAGAALEADHLEALLGLCRANAGSKRLSLPGLVARREYDRLGFQAVPDDEVLADVQVLGEEGPYEVRVWQPGDRMRPTRLKGRSRKLHDLFVNLKVPSIRRRRARVVVRSRDGEIVWAEHVGVAYGANVRVALTKRDVRAINERQS